jgi:hypothetical protein
MTPEILIEKIASEPLSVEFAEVIQVIDAFYHYRPTAFNNGALENAAGHNEGSCKILAFAWQHGLSEAQTLACFGVYYREHVLAHPDGTDHGNIRQFIEHGWEGVEFLGQPLTPKSL